MSHISKSTRRTSSSSKLICTYDIINEVICQGNNDCLSVLLAKADHELLAKYNKSDRRTLVWHSVESNNPGALAEVILHITKSDRINGNILKLQKCLNRGMQCSLHTKHKKHEVAFTPLVKSLQILRKDNSLKNNNSYYSTQCIFILVIGCVEVDCLALIEPINDSKNPRDYQIVHPLSIAYELRKQCLFFY